MKNHLEDLLDSVRAWEEGTDYTTTKERYKEYTATSERLVETISNCLSQAYEENPKAKFYSMYISKLGRLFTNTSVFEW